MPVTHETRDGGPLEWCGRLSEDVASSSETAFVEYGELVSSSNDGYGVG